MLALSSTREVVARLQTAREVEVEAYTIHGEVERQLEAAARRGARVAVELEAAPYDDPRGGLAKENARLVKRMTAAGIDARLADCIHAKAIRVDGTLYLDGKNWGKGDLVVRDDDASEAARIPMSKPQALAQEAALLREAGANDRAIVESESFGTGNVTYDALKALGAAGAAPRLLVSQRVLRNNERERAVLEHLVRDGVRVRVCSDSEKLAAAGDRAWLGSANATVTFGRADMTDWGCRTSDARIVSAVRTRLEELWQSARPLKSQKA